MAAASGVSPGSICPPGKAICPDQGSPSRSARRISITSAPAGPERTTAATAACFAVGGGGAAGSSPSKGRRSRSSSKGLAYSGGQPTDGLNHLGPSVPGKIVAHALDHHELGTGNGRRRSLATGQRDKGISRTVNHQRRNG